MMMRKVLERFHSSPAAATSDSMEVGGGGVDLPALQERFCREYTCLYLRIADSARLQCNYAVARKYLKLTEKAINEVANLVR